MAASEAVSSLPLPPPYYKLFAPKESIKGKGGEREDAMDTEDLEEDAGKVPVLEPPPPPGAGESYEMFGITYKVEPEIEHLLPMDQILFKTKNEQSAEKNEDGAGFEPAAVEVVDYKTQMKILLESLMANYVQLLEVLNKCPDMQSEKVAALEQLFVNFHDVLNQFRAHEAREMLARRLRHQIHEEEHELKLLETAIQNCTENIQGAVENLPSITR